jgi:hypothetical protein
MTEDQQSRIEQLSAAFLPVERLVDAFPHLRRPFSPAAVKWKVQTDWGSGAVIIAYIDARLVIERLNAVCPTFWEPRFEVVGDNLMACHLTMADGNRTLTRSDVGAGQGRTSEDRAKAMRSDALKRAAVHYGVGVPVYSMKAVTLNVGEGDGELRTMRRKKKQRDGTWQEVSVPYIDRRTEQWLSEMYEKWLGARGIPMFGPVLDHGDEFGSAGIEEVGLPEQQGRDTLGDGDGDGAEPGWGDKLTPEQIGKIEQVITRARSVGHAALGDRGAIQTEMAGMPENVDDWYVEAMQELDDHVKARDLKRVVDKVTELAGDTDRARVEEARSSGWMELDHLALRIMSEVEGLRGGATAADFVPENDPGARLDALAAALHDEAVARQS